MVVYGYDLFPEHFGYEISLTEDFLTRLIESKSFRQ